MMFRVSTKNAGSPNNITFQIAESKYKKDFVFVQTMVATKSFYRVVSVCQTWILPQ